MGHRAQSRGLQSSAHAPAVLSHWRAGETVNGMPHQASYQGRSESRVSRQEVASPCGFSLPLGWILPLCVRLTSVVEKTVDGVTEGEVSSETE